MSFADIIRDPDRVTVTTEERVLSLKKVSGGCWEGRDITVALRPGKHSMTISLSAPRSAVKEVRAAWRCAPQAKLKLLGDAWERGYGDLQWRPPDPERVMPWYCLAHDGRRTHGYGVKTGPNTLCYWQAGAKSITLGMNTRCGGRGVLLGKRTLAMAEVVAREGFDGESPFAAAREFCAMMCEKPLRSAFPVYGSNNWYYAYGRSSHEDIIRDTKIVSELSDSSGNRPFMVIDDGWEITYGGPWVPNSLFPGMARLADEMKKLGARPGIWERPLYTFDTRLKSLAFPANYFKNGDKGWFLDPSIPAVLEQVTRDVKLMTGWGYELIKHDFTSYDVFGRWGPAMSSVITSEGWSFSDRGRTSAEIMLGLYRAIRGAAGTTLLIGCNTFSLLAAGLFELQRTGDDTSGREWERTRKMGINTLAFRMPQHGTFYCVDADCVGLTRHIPWRLNKQWLELLGKSGTPLFVSAAPDALGPEQKKALKAAFRVAAKPRPAAEPLDWLTTPCPRKWQIDGKVKSFTWD